MATETRSQTTGLTEKRYQPTTTPPKIESRSVGDSNKEYIIGQGVIFDSRSELLGGFFYETIHRDAFKETDISDVVGLFNHDDNIVLGRTLSGTLTFNIRTDGVFYEIDPPESQLVRDMVMAPMRRGDIRGSSFQFTIPDEEGAQEWKYDKQNQVYHRTIYKVERLIDLSPVTRPAYGSSTSGLSKRSAELYESYKDRTEAEIKEELQKQEDNERLLKENYLRSTARARVRMYALSNI